MAQRQTTPEGHEFVVGGREATYEAWPQSDTHTWGMFAGLAVELGGYCDVELIDPGTGRTFWFQPADHRELAKSPEGFPFARVLRQAIEAAEAVGWFDGPGEVTPVGPVG